MPNYGTVSGVHALYPRIGSVSAVTSDTITTFLNHAESKVHAFLAARYSTPISGSPPLLKYVSETLATALILRRFFSQEQENKSEWVDGMFEEVKETLTGLSDGSISLVDSSNGLITSSRVRMSVWSSTQGYSPTMTLLDPISQEVDPDRLSDIEDRML
jgi:phage gp36-like protein